MKTVLYLSILFSLLFSFSGCDQPNQIRAGGQKSMLQSFMRIKQRMGFKDGTEFEVAFWSLKQKSNNDDAAFRSLVNGKTPEQIIEQAKLYFEERKQANDPKYTQYESWDVMINKVIEEIKTPVSKKNLPDTSPSRNKANRIQGF